MNKEEIIGFEALYTSMCKCKSNVLWKSSTSRFYLHGLENILKLESDIKHGTYIPQKPYRFKITSPKPREIMSIGFRDRVYQRSLNDIAVYPAICKSFIYDNAACQKGKGTSFAMSRLKLFLHKMYRRYGTEFYVLQCDIHGYYPNMSHKVAKDRFYKSLDRWTYDRCVEVLDGQYATDTGYNPGSQMVQIAGISVLDNMDHLIKEQLRVKYYVRYMDDFVLLSNDKTYLENCRKEIARLLSKIKFELHPKKTRLYKINNGIDFLGFKFKLTDTGKVVLLIDTLNVKKRRKKLYRMVDMVKSGNMSKHKVYECNASWKAHASKGNTFKVVQRMEQYLKKLWEGDTNGSY